MSFFDFTADYKSSPSLPKQEPDPFANYVEPAGDLTTQNFAAWDTPAPANTPAPAATYTPVAQNKWNEQYQAWEDQSGNLWDSSSGLWYSITDPSNPLIYRPEVGWQNVTQYNDYNNELNALGAYSANPMVKQISSGDWQNIQSYMDRPEPSPRADFINYDLATSKNVPFPEDVRYSLENADLPYEIRDGAKWYGAPAEGGGLTAPWDKYAEPAAAKLGDAYNWYTKNIQTPISETLSQATPTALSLTKNTVPGMQLPFAAVDIATGYNPDERILSGATQLGSAIGESKGDPLKFRDIQNENFAERPAWQQLAASTVYDPLNLVGSGLGAKALSSGALEGTGLLSQILRGAAKVDKGIDVAQTAAFGTALKPLGTALRPLASEAGSLPAKVAARAAVATGAGAVGYATGDGMDPEDRFLRALAFAAVPAAGPEATDLAARAYGKIPHLADAGLGRKTWLENAPAIDVLEGKNLNPAIYLKDVTGKSGLPLNARISNTFWDTLAKLDQKDALTKIDDGRVYWIADQHRFNEGRIGEVAENTARVAGEDFSRAFDMDAKGRILTPTGEYLPALDNAGNIQKWKGKEVYGATAADLADHADTYLARNLISQAQYDALKRMSDAEREVTELLRAFGIKVDDDLTVGPDGFHLTRGRATDELADATPTRQREPRQEGRVPGTTKKRGFQSEAIGLMEGKEYPTPIDALRKYIDESYRTVNAANSSLNLAKIGIEVELKDGKHVLNLGDLLRHQEVYDELAEKVKAIRETKRELRKLTVRQTRVDRDRRLGSAWVQTNRNRAEKLAAIITDQSISATARAAAAHDALGLARTAFSDARASAADYVRQTAKAAAKESNARQSLNTVLDEATRISRAMDAIENKIRQGEFVDLQQEFSEVWHYADTIRNATAADVAALERRLANLPYDDVSDTFATARNALTRAKGNFSESLGELRKAEADAVKYAQMEAKAASNVRAAVNSGRLEELERLTEKRGAQLERMAEHSKELQEHIAQLKENLLPLEQSRDTLKQDIAITRELGKDISGKFPTGKIKLRGWENVHLPHDLANAWTKYEKGPKGTNGLVALFDLANNSFRAIGATADASRTATVGLLGLAENPATTIQGLKAGLASAKDPEVAFKFLREIEEMARKEGLPSLAEAAGKYRLELASAEHMLRGMADEGTWAANLAKRPVLRQAEALYSTPGNVERAQRFYDNLRVLRARGQDWTSDKARAAAANAANVTTGRATRGVFAPIVGERASSRIAFAGRFVQSQLDTIYNAILVGGIEGETSRRALLRVVGGAAALTYGANEILGNETDFRIAKDGRLNPDFMKIRVAGQDISLLGPWESLAKGLVATAQGDGDNFVRGKLAPGAGIAWDVAVNRWRDPLDRPIDSREGLARMFPLPFGVRNIGSQALDTDFTNPGEIGSLALGAATSMLGIKSSPLSPREEYTERLESKYDDYKPEVNYPHPSDVYEDPLFIREYAASHPNEVPGPATALGKEMKEIRDARGAELDALNKKFADDKITLGTWKEQRKSIKNDQRTQLEPLIKKMRDAVGHDPEEGSPAWWLNKYFQTFEEAKDSETHQIDTDQLDQLQAAFLKETKGSNAEWVMDYIDSYTLAGADPGPEREYLEAIQKLNEDGYFDGGMPRYTGMISGLSDREIDKAKAFISGSEEKHPELAGIKDYMTKAFMILDAEGYTIEQIVDVVNSNKKAFENPVFTIYKFDNPQLVEWLDTGNFYSTLKAVASR